MLSRKRKNKNASILDWAFILISLFLIGLIVVISLFITNIVGDIDIFKNNVKATEIIGSTKNTLLSQDNLFLFVLIGLSVFTIISASMVWNHPAFFIVMLFLLSVFVTLAAIVSNAYEDVTTSSQLNATTASFPKINFVMDKLPMYVAIMGMITGLVMYAAYTRQ